MKEVAEQQKNHREIKAKEKLNTSKPVPWVLGGVEEAEDIITR
jgi:hypothetical protein